ncbi:MAG: DMT family transporter [Alphaproteobacteria bacterium]|nr:DMT family transporter [Alphaproteobacteria bacterium]
MTSARVAVRLNEPLKGIACSLGATLIFSSQEVVFKFLAADYSIFQLVFIRTWFAFIPAAIFLMRAGGPRLLITRSAPYLMVRGCIGFAAFSSYFYAISKMPLADASAISFAAPLILTALSVPILKERVGLHRWGAVIVGFLGVLFIVHPGDGTFQIAAAFALAAAFFYSVSAIIVRYLSGREKSAVVVCYTLVAFLLFSGAAQPFVWVPPDPIDVAIMAVTGLTGGVAQFLMTQAYRFAPVSVTAPFDYLHLVWATICGLVFFGHFPTVAVLCGAAVVIASGLYIVRHETLANRSKRGALP